MQRLQQVLTLVTCLMILAAAAILRDGRLWGCDINEKKPGDTGKADTPALTATSPEEKADMVINTTETGKDIMGYAGPIPLEIRISGGRITGIDILANSETPDFLEQASRLLTAWNGKTIEEARALQVDAVSGATYSSRAIIDNVRIGLEHAARTTGNSSSEASADMSAKTAAVLLTVLLGAIVPLFYKHRHYRTFQLLLNIVVLGFWSGTFLNYAFFIRMMSAGIDPWHSLPIVVMLIAAFIYPLFDRKNHYCTHICPLGSLQEMAGRAGRPGWRWKMSPSLTRRLTLFREILWITLMVLTLTGTGLVWMDYELFSAFVFQAASGVVIALATVFVLLSVFVPRPYCRFICPTGTLFKIAQNHKSS